MSTLPDPIQLTNYRQIVILTGAGISAASGIRTFRGPGGLWEEVDPVSIARESVLRTNPHIIWQYFGPLRSQLKAAGPNPAHHALARMEQQLCPGQSLTLITQNIDGLHQRAGTRSLVEMHGSVARTRCSSRTCSLEPYLDEEPHTDALPVCPRCGSGLRLDIVLFDEMIPRQALERSQAALQRCDLFIAVGTSGEVYPAADYVRLASQAGARTVLVNLEPMHPRNPYFQEVILGRAEEILPHLFSNLPAGLPGEHA